MTTPKSTVGDLDARTDKGLAGLIGLEVIDVGKGRLTSRMKVRDELMAPNGYLHAASVVALADSSCGSGTVAHLPEGAERHATIELKSNFLGSAHEGWLRCEARLVHGGTTTQVWDAEVIAESSGETIALFRCTQMIIYPKPPS